MPGGFVDAVDNRLVDGSLQRFRVPDQDRVYSREISFEEERALPLFLAELVSF